MRVEVRKITPKASESTTSSESVKSSQTTESVKPPESVQPNKALETTRKVVPEKLSSEFDFQYNGKNEKFKVIVFKDNSYKVFFKGEKNRWIEMRTEGKNRSERRGLFNRINSERKELEQKFQRILENS